MFVRITRPIGRRENRESLLLITQKEKKSSTRYLDYEPLPSRAICKAPRENRFRIASWFCYFSAGISTREIRSSLFRATSSWPSPFPPRPPVAHRLLIFWWITERWCEETQSVWRWDILTRNHKQVSLNLSRSTINMIFYWIINSGGFILLEIDFASRPASSRRRERSEKK